ncbi:MAG: GntR family transcriptional regulator [Gammaproteobacteria bacterium]
MELPSIRPVTRLVDSVRKALRTAILDGTLPPGSPLSVPDLSRRLQVSRSPIREAVLQMVADGLAVERPRRGVAVASIAPQDVVEIHVIREALEALSARLCAARIDEKGLADLEAILERQKECVRQNDGDGYFETNAAFHSLIARYSGNQRLQEILAVLSVQMQMGLRQVAGHPDQQRLGLKEHRLVLDAIRAGASARAEKLMRSHMTYTKQRLLQRIDALETTAAGKASRARPA